LLAGLKQAGATTNLAPLGDPFLLDHEFDNASAREVRNTFGEKFAAALGNLSPGQWQGPVESGYGVHVVFLAERTEGRLPPLEDVREAVRREWANAQRLEAAARLYQALLQRYTVTIETPRAAGGTQDPAGARR
jgi:parvulin-like peptidyl-prolyl isomerase